MFADQREKTRVDGRPDAAGRSAVVILHAQARHIVDGHLDPHFHRLHAPGVDDRDFAIRPTQEAGDLLQRALCRGEPDPLWLDLGQSA